MKQILTEEQFKTIMRDEATTLAAEHYSNCNSEASFFSVCVTYYLRPILRND